MSDSTTTTKPQLALQGLIPALVLPLICLLASIAWGNTAADFDSLPGETSVRPQEEHLSASPVTWPAVTAISLYQKTISPQQGSICAFQPTCSHFAQCALRKYGLLQGSLMASDRLQRCHYCASWHYSSTEKGFSFDPVEGHSLWGDGQLSPFQLPDWPISSMKESEEWLDPLVAFGEHLCGQGDHQRAYRQFIAFWQSSFPDPMAGWALLRAGICLQKMNRWSHATRLFEDLKAQKASSTLTEESNFQLALTKYLAGEPVGALQDLSSLEGTSRGERASLLAGWIHLQHGRWSLAKACADNVLGSSRTELENPACSLLKAAAKGTQLPSKSPLLAASLSTVIPGSGKWYAGKPLDGLYSLLVIGGTAAVTYSYGHDQRWIQAGFFGSLGLFLHLGNIFGSAVEAKRFNERSWEALLQDLRVTSQPERWLWELENPPRKDTVTAIKESPLIRAEEHFRREQYDEAITEYKRHLFLSADDAHRADMHYRIGLACCHEKNWSRARNHLQAAESLALTVELRYRARLRRAQSLLSQGLLEQARWSFRDLLSDPMVSGDKQRSAEVQYWAGVCALRTGEWVRAAGILRLLEDHSAHSPYPYRAQTLAQAAREGYHLPRRWPALAGGLSILLPGSGQIYSGHIWDGLFSLALNVSVGYVTIDAFRDGRQLDGILLTTLLWSRFYFGGQQNAIRYARDYNRAALEKHLERYHELLIPKYDD